LSDAVWQKKDSLFSSSKVEDLNTKQIINKIYKSYGYVLDPHTAVAADEAFKKSNADNHFIILATAHPAKFPKVYEELQIKLSSLPKGLHDLEKKKEYLHTFNANYNDIKDFIKLNN
jgi:threonine synthase